MQDQALAVLRSQFTDIVFGTVFLLVGFAACGIAAMYRRSGVRVLVFLGVWSAMYGARPLADSMTKMGILPHWFQAGVPYMDTVILYLILVVATLAWMELTAGKLRSFLKVVTVVGMVIGLAGIVYFIFTGVDDRLILYNHLLATCSLAVLVTVVAVPGLSRKFLVIQDRGVLLVGTLVFAVEALYVNLSRPLRYPSSSLWDDLGFAVLLFSFGYVALRNVIGNQWRLQAIEKELAIAREIQTAIIPSHTPELSNLRITAAYRPMTYVAGDFYDFISVDQHRVGLLVADVSGHGVPAALIASMIKVATRSIVPCAHDPREVLRGLNRALSGQLRNQFVTASYLWIDTENHTALYSAAGHPPLLRWREGKLERIESNGLLFGVMPEPDYPVCDMPIIPGDRFLLYTDGLTEPENSRGIPFGDRKLEQVIRRNQSCPASDLADQLFAEIRDWQPATDTQQDDITLIIADVI
ncbi:MAG: PP2C family protein-serine/threonine phosphatase [Terriglobia bacterium]